MRRDPEEADSALSRRNREDRPRAMPMMPTGGIPRAQVRMAQRVREICMDGSRRVPLPCTRMQKKKKNRCGTRGQTQTPAEVCVLGEVHPTKEEQAQMKEEPKGFQYELDTPVGDRPMQEIAPPSRASSAGWRKVDSTKKRQTAS